MTEAFSTFMTHVTVISMFLGLKGALQNIMLLEHVDLLKSEIHISLV